MEEKTIKVTCKGTGAAAPEAFTPFQDDIKFLGDREFAKLKQSIVRHGFAMPLLVWKDHQNKLLDGHQRVLTIKKMVEDGFVLEGGALPFVEVEADDEKQATEKVLAFVSQYGKIDDDKLYELIETRGLDFQIEKETISLPNFNMKSFEENYYTEGGEFEDLSDVKTEHKCPKCGYRWSGDETKN